MHTRFGFTLLLLASIALGGCQNKPLPTPVVVVSTPQPMRAFSFTATESGKTALEVTKQNVSVEAKQYDFGVMVESINGQKPDSAHFWGLYVNGELAQTGADKLLVNKNDIVSWKYETIK